MTLDLRADLDAPIRIVLWAAVVVVGVVALEPAALYLPGSPLVGLAAVSTYLALAHLAIRVTLGSLHRSVRSNANCAEAAGPVAALGPAGAMSFQLASHGAALLLCGFGQLPADIAQTVPYLTLRLGGVLVGLGLIVVAALYRRIASRRAPRPTRPDTVFDG